MTQGESAAGKVAGIKALGLWYLSADWRTRLFPVGATPTTVLDPFVVKPWMVLRQSQFRSQSRATSADTTEAHFMAWTKEIRRGVSGG